MPIGDPKDLRPLLHEEIDRLPDEELEKAHRALLEIELAHVVTEIDDAFDHARTEGKLTAESIAAAVAEHRKKHPYRR
jgi:hypothetical protein